MWLIHPPAKQIRSLPRHERGFLLPASCAAMVKLRSRNQGIKKETDPSACLHSTRRRSREPSPLTLSLCGESITSTDFWLGINTHMRMMIIPIRHVLRLRSTRRLKGGNHGLPSSRAFIKKSSPVSSKRGFLLAGLPHTQ